MSQLISDTLQFVSFTLINKKNEKKEDYAAPIEQVREIRTIEEITQVPKSKSYVKGVMNLRGLIIPVIDIRDKLGFGKTEITNKSKQKILITDVDESLYGILIDSVDQVMRIPQKDIEPVPQDTFENHNYIKGIAKTQQKLVVILDLNTLLSESDTKDSNKSHDFTSVNKIKSPNSLPVQKNEVDDDIPAELLEVLEEDKKVAIESKKEAQQELSNSNKNNLNDFQLRVNQESGKF